MVKHIIHHQGSPRSDIGDLLGIVIVVFIAIAGIGTLFSVLAPILGYLIVIVLTVAVLTVAIFIVRALAKPILKKLMLSRLLRDSRKCLARYASGKAALELLTPNDRKLAERKLAAIRESGHATLAKAQSEISARKTVALEKIGNLPANKLAAILAPFSAMEAEIEKMRNEFNITA